ncbi:MAG: ATP-binding cassette domain-containing protein [Armatimonadetes bacterium]|nr:ATP-binding cassette domain-containing protein [Armatimonadota bacterium]
MVVVEDLVKAYGPHVAVDGVSFEVEKGEILGFLGPNGAGKTTTMRVLTCFLPATSGTARIAGFDVYEDSREVRRRLGYLPENVPLYLDMSVDGYLAYMGRLKGMSGADLPGRLEAVTASCGLSERRRDIIGRLSRGFRQRVGLAQALIHDPDVLILDEPTASLDPVQIREVRQHIKELAGKHTVILSTHILPEVELVCDRVLVINKGKIVANDTPSNLTSFASAGQVLTVEARGEHDGMVAAAKRVDGVRSVAAEKLGETIEGARRLRIEAVRDVREDVARELVNGGFGLLRLEVASRSLEDIFVELTTEEPVVRGETG